MKSVFLDSGVIVDFMNDRTRQTEATASILTLAELKQLKVFVSPLLFSELYSEFAGEAGHKKVIDKLRKLKSITRPLKMNSKIISQALNAELENFEISLHYSIARSNKKIEAIVTNDIRDYGDSKIALFTPETFLMAYWNS
jgi:predicted nucleic acid-binding protein